MQPCSPWLHDNRSGVSRGNKNVGCGTWKRRFFALAVWITGKLLKIDGYMLRGFGKHWIVFHSCNVLRDCHRGVPRGNKNVVKIAIFGLTHWLKHETVEYRYVHAAKIVANIELSFNPCNILRDNRMGVSRGNKNVGCVTWKRRFFCTCGWNNWETVEDGFGKHYIVFSFMQRFAWLP